jgi:hypothetical protein
MIVKPMRKDEFLPLVSDGFNGPDVFEELDNLITL